jgi:hypothetical protein
MEQTVKQKAVEMGDVGMSMYHYGNEIPRLRRSVEFQFQHDLNRFSLLFRHFFLFPFLLLCILFNLYEWESAFYTILYILWKLPGIAAQFKAACNIVIVQGENMAILYSSVVS